jgi:membrane protease YdiL (CAAX protease family)
MKPGQVARQHPVGAFLVWFFPVGWTIALIPTVARRAFGLELPLELFLVASTLLGLLLPAVVITWLVDGPTGVRTLLRPILQARASVGWYAVALLAVPLVAVVLAVIVFGPPTVTLSTLVSAVVSGLIVQAASGFITINLWEETTWMGFVQARLQARRGVIVAAILTAALFTLQHVPLVIGNGVEAAGLVILLVFFVVAIPFRALVAWVYNRTGSLFLVGLLHAVGDATGSGSFGAGLLPRLYEGYDIGFFHIAANALIGVVVIAATRARLGLPARPTPRAEVVTRRVSRGKCWWRWCGAAGWRSRRTAGNR